MAAALLTEEPVILENIPQVRDIETTRKLLAAMGAEVELGYGRAQHRTTICCRNLTTPEASYELVKTMRASTLVLGPAGRALWTSARFASRRLRHRRTSHRSSHQRSGKTGCKNHQEHGYIEASAERLKGAEIVFDKITVTGTEDLLMAATLADGETVMQNCAREPEVADLADLLNKMGAKIEGAGTPTIRVKGVEQASRREAPHHSRPHRGRRHSSSPARLPEATSTSPDASRSTSTRCFRSCEGSA